MSAPRARSEVLDLDNVEVPTASGAGRMGGAATSIGTTAGVVSAVGSVAGVSGAGVMSGLASAGSPSMLLRVTPYLTARIPPAFVPTATI